MRRCEEARRGELKPDRLLCAYEQVMGPKTRNRGAIFMVACVKKNNDVNLFQKGGSSS